RETPSLSIGRTVIEPGAVIVPGAAQVRREEEHQAVIADQRESDKQDITQGIGEDLQGQLIVVPVMHDVESRKRRTGSEEAIAAGALQIDPAPLTHEVEAEIPDLRLTGRRPVDLVDDAVADGCPEPRAVERRGHKVLVAR